MRECVIHFHFHNPKWPTYEMLPSHLLVLGHFREEEREKKAWKRMMPHWAISDMAIWKAIMFLITVTAVQAGKKKRAGERNGPGLFSFCSFSWLAQPQAKYYGPGIWKHITESCSAIVEHCINAHSHLQIHSQWRTKGKEHRWNHAQNTATGKAQELSTEDLIKKIKHIKGHGQEENQVFCC